MDRKATRGFTALALAACIASAVASGCSALASYSRTAGASACASFDRCTVYDADGARDVPCFAPWGERTTVIAGQSGWPFSPGVCDQPLVKPTHTT